MLGRLRNKRNHWYVPTLLALLLLTMAVLAGCGPAKTGKSAGGDTDKGKPVVESASEKPKEILKAKLHDYGPASYNPQTEIAIEKGFFKEEGLEIEKVQVQPDQLAVAIESRQIDFTPIAYGYGIATLAKSGAKVKFISAGQLTLDLPYTDYLWVPKDGGIKTQKDLVGKKIGTTNINWVGTWYFNKWLQQEGVNWEQTNLVNVPIAQQFQSLETGALDGLLTSGGGLLGSQITKTGKYKTLFNLKKLFGNDYPSSTIVVTDALIKENPELVRRFVAGLAKANDYANTHLKEVVDLGIKQGKLTQEAADLGYGTDYSRKEFAKHALQDEKVLAFWIKFHEDQGLIEKGQFKPSDVYTNEFNPYYKK